MKKYFIVGALAVSMLMPFLAGAVSVDELQAQIKVLMAQVASLQAQLKAQQGGGTTPWCHTFERNLGVGSRGLEVAVLMTALSRSGNDTGTGSSDPNPPFSENTASAVTAFQEKYKDEILAPSGLKKGTGYVGPATRKKLNQLYGCSNQSNSITSLQSSNTSTIFEASKSIKIISPTEGYKWNAGEAHKIEWSGGEKNETAAIYLSLYGYGGSGIHYKGEFLGNYLSNKLIANTKNVGYYSWIIPGDIKTDSTLAGIKVCTGKLCGTSVPFCIVTSSEPPQVIQVSVNIVRFNIDNKGIMSPKIFQKGDIIPIDISTKCTISDFLNIYLKNATSTYTIAKGWQRHMVNTDAKIYDSKYNWTVGSILENVKIPAGEYTFEVCDLENKICASDWGTLSLE